MRDEKDTFHPSSFILHPSSFIFHPSSGEFLMSIPSWIRSLFTRPAARTIRKAPRRARLSLEALEERWCPSTIVVNSALDNVNDANITGPTITLREAVNYANANGGGAITFDPTAFPTATPQTINLAFGQLELMTGTETITGPAGGVTVSGGGLSQVLQVDSLVTASISGLTISGGNAGAAGNGGGLANFGATTLSNCTLSGNSAGYLGGSVNGFGGAVYGDYRSTTTLDDCIVSGNVAIYGGGLDSHGVLALLDSCTITNNTADHGGALENYLGATTLTDCTLSGNTSTKSGGALFLVGGATTLTDCTVSGNSASRGGALFAAQETVRPSPFTGSSDNYLGTTTLTNCTVSGNKAISDDGGGVHNYNSNVTLTNCTISGNSALQGGGGVFNYGGQTTLAGCTLSGNSAGILGGGVGTNALASQTTLTNCTLSGNSAPEGGGLWMSGLSSSAPTSATLLNCTVSGNSATQYVCGGVGHSLTGSVTLGNTIVAGNTEPGTVPDVYGAMVSLGHNLIGNTYGSSGWVIGSDLTAAASAPLNPLLAPLGNYGGPLVGAPGAQQVIQTRRAE
jgi:fibronectin-binding autotransporter adhesin